MIGKTSQSLFLLFLDKYIKGTPIGTNEGSWHEQKKFNDEAMVKSGGRITGMRIWSRKYVWNNIVAGKQQNIKSNIH